MPTQTAKGAAAPSYLVQWASDVDGAVLDDFVHHLRDRLREVRVGELDETKEQINIKNID